MRHQPAGAPRHPAEGAKPVTDVAPDARDYRISMGYGCPDTAPCDAEFFGFYNQVYKAAWQFRQYTQYPAGRRYVIGPTYIQYHPSTSCGGSTVNIRNQATANLYLYRRTSRTRRRSPTCTAPATPAVRTGTGTSGCSTTRGSDRRQGVRTPSETSSSLRRNPAPSGSSGWAIDPNTSASIDVHVYVGSVGPSPRRIANDPMSVRPTREQGLRTGSTRRCPRQVPATRPSACTP